MERCVKGGGNCQPWRRLPLSSEPCLRQTHISSGHVCRCCAAVVNHSLESQHSLLEQKRYTSDEQNQTSFQVFDYTKLIVKSEGCYTMKTCFSPCPPGYMQRKALPSSSACTRPAGVSSPPHFNTSSKDGPSLRVSEKSQHEFSYAGLAAMFGNRIDISYLPPHLRFWAAHGAGM